MYEMANEAREEMENWSTVDRSVRIERRDAIEASSAEPPKAIEAAATSSSTTTLPPPPPPPPQTQALSTAPPRRRAPQLPIDESMGVIKSAAHERLSVLLRDMEALAKHYLSLYGAVRGSGIVVEKPHVPTGADNVSLVTENPAIAEDNTLMCANCGVMRLIDEREAIATCPQCAVAVPYTEMGEKGFNYKEKPDMESVKKKNYDPKNYAARWLAGVQGKLKNEVPDEVFALLFRDFYIRRLRTVTERIVRRTLKRHNLTDYYRMVPLITYKFNEVPLPEFSEEEEAILAKMFFEYKAAFYKCPMEIRRRKSLMSYPYFYHQCVAIQGWTHYRKCFPLLEGEKNLRRHDRTWKWICENKDGEKWPYYPTI